MLDGILLRLGSFVSCANYMLFESEYNETTWKDMISLFYVDNAPSIKTTVMRVHTFKGEVDCYNLDNPQDYESLQNNYLGYFNIRPILELRDCISYAMVNYSNYKIICNYGAKRQSMHIITYDRNVHIHGRVIPIKTFPFFGRDNKLVVCAQADLLMMSRYIYRKLHMPELTLRHICQSRSRDRLDVFPTHGITKRQILDIFYSRDIFVRNYHGSFSVRSSSTSSDFYSMKIIGQLILAYLDSSLPVFLVFGEHIVIANGVSEMIRTEIGAPPKRTISIYDDSGDLLRKFPVYMDKNPPIPFLGLCCWEHILNAIAQFPEYRQSGHEDICVLVLLYQRITLDYISLLSLIAKSEILSDFLFEGIDIKDVEAITSSPLWSNSRVFIVECNQLKSALEENEQYWDHLNAEAEVTGNQSLIDSMAVLIKIQRLIKEKIMNLGIPHYYWCFEIPSFGQETTNYAYLIFNASPAILNDEKQICMNILLSNSLLNDPNLSKNQLEFATNILKMKPNSYMYLTLDFEKPIVVS